MHVGISLILKLTGEKPAVCLGQFNRLVHHAQSALGGRCQNNLDAEKTHQFTALNAECFRHRDHQRIAFGCANHCKTDAGIAGRRLDHGLPWLEFTGFLRSLDNTERQTVLDRSEGIEGLDLYEEVDVFRRDPVDPHNRRTADRFENIREFSHHSLPFARFQIHIFRTRPYASSTASFIISDRVGCGKIVCISSSSVVSRFMATT